MSGDSPRTGNQTEAETAALAQVIMRLVNRVIDERVGGAIVGGRANLNQSRGVTQPSQQGFIDHDHSAATRQGQKLAQTNTHESPDTDSATGSLHHTIGTTATTAAAGNHKHGMTTAGDIIVGDTGGAPIRLGKGSDNQVLTVDPATHLLAWKTPLVNPMTTQDDIIVGGAAGILARLAKGTDGQVLTVDPATHHLIWATPTGGGSALTVREADSSPTDSAVSEIVFPNGTIASITSHVVTLSLRALNPMTTKGDVIAGGASGAESRLGVGSNGLALVADSAQTLGLAWGAPAPAAHKATHEVGGSDVFTGLVPGSGFVPGGLTGATAASRYVGATTGGAPASGTFAVGDYAIGQTGIIWVCTVAGSPGTWVGNSGAGAGSSRELGYTQVSTSNITTSSTSLTDITGATITVTVGSRPIKITFYAEAADSTTGDARVTFSIRDTTGGGNTEVGGGIVNGANSTVVQIATRIAPASGSRSYKVQWSVASGASGRMLATATRPIWLMVVEQ